MEVGGGIFEVLTTTAVVYKYMFNVTQNYWYLVEDKGFLLQ